MVGSICDVTVVTSISTDSRRGTGRDVYQSYTTSRMSMITAVSMVTCQIETSNMLVSTNIPSVAVQRTESKMAPHFSTSMEGGSMADSSP